MIRNLMELIRREGLQQAVRDLAGVLSPARFEIWHLALDSADLAPVRRGNIDLLTGLPALEDLKTCRRRETNLPIEFYRDEIDGIDSCVLVKVGERLAAIAWIYYHHQPGHFLKMSSGEAEIRSVFSLPDFRGQGLAKAVVAAASSWLRNIGCHSVYAVIHFQNTASLKAFQAAGFKKIAEIHRRPLFGPRYVTSTGQVQWFRKLAKRAETQAKDSQPV